VRPLSHSVERSGTRARNARTVAGRSIGSKSDCFDNAVAESVFATLEKDLSRRESLRTHGEAEAFYYPIKLHPTLGYRSPVE